MSDVRPAVAEGGCEVRYRIDWVNRDGTTGHGGRYYDDRAEAERVAGVANRSGIRDYHVVPFEDPGARAAAAPYATPFAPDDLVGMLDPEAE